jgi:hypothetical protein
MSYAYDVFISYTRRGEAGDWVRNHFEPRLRGWLDQSMVEAPRIFWDRDIETGQTWPITLRTALAQSRVLVPVLTMPYFRSAWCVAELNTMIAREQMLALRSAENADGIIYPVRFFGEGFPDPIPAIQYEDMSEWAYPNVGFQEAVKYMDFVDAVRAFASKLAQRLPQAPDWHPDWPVRMPEPAAMTEVPVPRL